MKFLCDVHIPYKLSKHLESLGYESLHINFILSRWNTKDDNISKYADENNCIVISKDADFKNSHFLLNTPRKLIKVALGNISNSELIDIFNLHIQRIEGLYSQDKFFLEISRNSIQIIS